MADAVRNVTIRLSIEPGEVTLPDLSGYKTAREDVAKLNTETKTFTELTKEAAANEKTLGEAARESAKAEQEKINAHRQVDKSAKQSADEQIAQTNRVSDTIAARMQADMEKYGRVGIQTHKGYVNVEQMEKDAAQAAEVSQQWRQREIDAEKKQVEAITNIREEAAVDNGPQGPQYLPDRSTYNASRRPLTEPGEENIARTQQARIKAEQEASQRAQALREALAQRTQQIEEEVTRNATEAANERARTEREQAEQVLRFRIAMNQQRLREETATEEALSTTRNALNQQRLREETQTRQAAEQAQQQLPRMYQQIQAGALGSAAATARLGLNLAMLTASGKKDTEELARNFVNIQAKIGLITQSKELFTGMNQTLQGLQQAGRLTQNIVQQQQALGMATTFSQAATMRLAGAAGTLQAAMGPVAIIAVAITAALTAAAMIDEAHAETAEDIAKRKEDQLRRYEDMHKTILKQMENEKLVMEEQNSLLNMKWEITRLLLGDQKMSVAEQKLEVEERQKLAKSQTEENFRLGVKELQNSPERAEREKKLAIEISDAQKAVDEKKKNAEGTVKDDALNYLTLGAIKPGVDMYNKNEIQKAEKKLKELQDQQKLQRTNEGDKGFEELLKTAFVDGKVKDEDKLRETMKTLPIEQQRKMQELIKTIEQGYQQQLAVNASALPRAERDLATAKANLPQLERDLITNGTFGEEENVARRYGTQAGQSARDQAMRQLDQFDAIKGTSKQDLQRKESITKEIEKTLTQDGVGLMTDDIKALLSKGSATDTSSTSGVREKIADASSIDAEEATAAKENYDKLKRLRDEAKDATANLPALIEEIRSEISRLKTTTDGHSRRITSSDVF